MITTLFAAKSIQLGRQSAGGTFILLVIHPYCLGLLSYFNFRILLFQGAILTTVFARRISGTSGFLGTFKFYVGEECNLAP